MPEKAPENLVLPVEALRPGPAEGALQFQRTDQLRDGPRHLGQERAIDALRFGVRIRQDGFNVFVLGPPGSHRHGLAEEIAKTEAAEHGAPNDWCYVHSFAEPERPRALSFPAGRGAEFRNDMENFIDELQFALPAAFEGDDYRSQLKAIESSFQQKAEEKWRKLEEHASSRGIGILQTPTGYVLALTRDGKVLDEKEFHDLPEEESKRIQEAIAELGEELRATIEQMPALRKRQHEQVKTLNREVSEHAVGALVEALKQKYRQSSATLAYLDEVERDVIENAQKFRENERSSSPLLARDSSRLFRRYEVNLVVSNDADAAPTVAYEPNPNYSNLVGKIEYQAEMGALITDFMMIRPGALLRANGGFLILDAARVLSRPFAWEALKQALFGKKLRIESAGESIGFVSTVSLKPQSIPLDVKVLLIGDRRLFYLLGWYDNEFNELFKVAADLDDDIEVTGEHLSEYSSLIAARISDCGLLPFSRVAVERVLEHRSRVAEDNERLSMHMRSLDDLLAEADYWARSRDASLVEPEDVSRAVAQQKNRLDRMHHKVIDAIRRSSLLIDTEGAHVGQVNGLSVIDMGETRFAHPVRITATTRIGSGDVVDIEREVELGGAIHSKGMMILSAALSARYAKDSPLSLNASVVFEQSYGGVEGDSASVAELGALLSSLSGVPIRQNLAVTGSINQLGRVQVVGGINEKIEGFFDVCSARGLDGSHGVIIPKENAKNLMLRGEVVEAVRDGRFRVYAVQTIDEAITLLTGVEAGSRDEQGRFPANTVNRKVEDQLFAYAATRKEYSVPSAAGNGQDEHGE